MGKLSWDTLAWSTVACEDGRLRSALLGELEDEIRQYGVTRRTR